MLANQHARVAKLADARDLKSRVPKGTYRFDSDPGHQVTQPRRPVDCRFEPFVVCWGWEPKHDRSRFGPEPYWRRNTGSKFGILSDSSNQHILKDIFRSYGPERRMELVSNPSFSMRPGKSAK
jgi:hypothetical protein